MFDTVELQPLLKDFFKGSMGEMNFCCPARVEGDQSVANGRIDVRPLQMPTYKDTSTQVMPVIRNVQYITPCTSSSGITFIPQQGDTVLLLFSQCSLDEFKLGSTEPYSPTLSRMLNLNDAVAIVGFTPFNYNPVNTDLHNKDYNIGDVSLFNNLGGGKENKINVKKDGTNKYIASSHNIDGDVNIKGNLYVSGDATVDGDIIIGGKSLKQFMSRHTHKYTDDGRPMQTDPPTGY